MGEIVYRIVVEVVRQHRIWGTLEVDAKHVSAARKAFPTNLAYNAGSHRARHERRGGY